MTTLKDLRESHSISQVDLAASAGISVHGVLRYEQMLYAKPSIKYLYALSELTGRPVGELEQIYREQRQHQINKTAATFSPFLSNRGWREQTLGLIEEMSKHLGHIYTPDHVSHPFVMFRTRLAAAVGQPVSQIHFCIMTCIHPSYLDNFEKGKTARVPRHLSELLMQGGFPKKDIDRLNSFSRKYQDWIRAND